MISFLKLRVSSLLGKTMELRRIVSEATDTPKPRIVVDGLIFPSLLKSGKFFIFANGLLGSGSTAVPSMRVHFPIFEFRPIIACITSVCSSIIELSRMIDSRIRTPAAITTPLPMLTLGPITADSETCADG